MLEREASEAERLAREAGGLLLAAYGTELEVAYKSPGDPVTDADVRSNAFLVEGLRRAFPGDAVVAEESRAPIGPARPDRVWYVDPLDGTKEFLAQTGDFAVMLGLSIDGEARLGVVYEPARDRLHAGVVGRGALLREGGATRAIRVPPMADGAAPRLVQSRAKRASLTDRLVERLGITERQRRGSMGIKACLVAAGGADLYVSFSDKSSAWDSCGPEAIVRAAGGCFVDLAGRPLVYGQGRREVRNLHGLIACNPACFARVMPDVEAIAESAGFLDEL
jgi:3'(2'), 5'-bisphosphate nucleotidase